MKNDFPNIAIVGAGPAGCVAASLLARSGCPVTLFEQHRLPRDKVCGECVSSVGVNVLRDVGVLHQIESFGAVPMHRALLHSVDGSSMQLALPSPMLGVSRRAMDAALLDHARSLGVNVRERHRCEGLSNDDRPTLHVRDLETNKVADVAADYVLLAEGKADWLAPRDRPRPTGDMGIKAHFRDVAGPRDAIELFSADGHYGGLAPIENETWNIAFSIPARQLRRGDVAGEFERVVHQNRALAKRLRHATRVGEWLASPLPRFGVIAESEWPTRVIPIGNAVAALEPIGGEGMGLAMRSAQLAANAIIEAHRSATSVNVPALRSEFVALWRTRSIACRGAAWMVSRPKIFTQIAEALGDSTSVSHAAMRMIGKA